MVAIICRNTDLGDGWKRGENPVLGVLEKKPTSAGINIVTYAAAGNKTDPHPPTLLSIHIFL